MHGTPVKKAKPRSTDSKHLDQAKNHAWEEYRKKQLAVIHIWKQQMKLGDEDYRDVLESITGKRSAGELDRAGIDAVITWFQDRGCAYPQNRKKYSPVSRSQPVKTQVSKIRALWIEMGKAGIVADPSESALNAFVKRMTKIDKVDWLNRKPRQANIVIEGLKSWAKREGLDLT